MNRLMLLGGIGAGAGLMYMLDPDMGRRRRALLRDQAVRLSHKACEATEAATRDLANRATGLWASLKSCVLGEGPVSDRQLAERVRSQIGRIVSHPSSIEVSAQDGKLTLRGPILAHEVDDLLCAVSSVSGVQEVNSQLEEHKEPGNVPGLQGSAARPPRWLTAMNLSPATRLLMATGGAALTLFGATRRAPEACVLGTLGLGLAVLGVANPANIATGLGVGGQAESPPMQSEPTVRTGFAAPMRTASAPV